MKKGITILALALLVIISSCEKESGRFVSENIGTAKVEVINDTETKLQWVNDVTGCFGAIVNPTDQCSNLNFGNKTDWRLPTAMEISGLIKGIDKEGIKLNYINTSCAYMSTSESKWVFTENSTSPGTIVTNEPGNAGVRCVRAN